MSLTLADFKGHWRLTRQIFDDARRETGQFQGGAVFQPDGAGLHYEETGTLHLKGQPPMTATQRYLWRSGSDGGGGSSGGIDVFFADGRAFHSIDLSDVRPDAHHHCAPDDYRVQYDFSQWPNWSSQWHVSGPRKAYEVCNIFARV
jgi:hypothetical protein